ncbi:MAG TPA: DUF1398 family protein [Janthinobacterium sp.]|nr:DUF1398 family protein [Janthinobacterium sp.]
MTAIMEECVRRSHDGTIAFGDVVAKLAGAGVESYHADFRRLETTYYMPSDATYVVKISPPEAQMADAFDGAAVAAAVLAIQRGEYPYLEFLRRIMAAGCIGYMVWIAGRQVHYFGRRGEIHAEHFPAAAQGAD